MSNLFYFAHPLLPCQHTLKLISMNAWTHGTQIHIICLFLKIYVAQPHGCIFFKIALNVAWWWGQDEIILGHIKKKNWCEIKQKFQQKLDYTRLGQNQLYQSQCVWCQITVLSCHPSPSMAVVQIRLCPSPKYTHTATKPPEHIHRTERERERRWESEGR